MNKLLIAEKIKVGFNPRNDTYSGKLAYIIPFDGKKWRKEDSWNKWIYTTIDSDEYELRKRKSYDDYIASLKKSHKYYIDNINRHTDSYHSQYKKWGEMTFEDFCKDQKISDYENYNPNLGRTTTDVNLTPIELINEPIEGFVLNKKVGGYNSGWNHRSTYCRVYDPRGFEFEISVPNLLYILQETNSYKGKGLEGKFIYGWDGKDLVLLPTSSPDYIESTNFTKLQSKKISTKDLQEGFIYKHKTEGNFIYLGRFYVFKYGNLIKQHCFTDLQGAKFNTYEVSSFGEVLSDTQVDNYAELMDKFNHLLIDKIDVDILDLEIPQTISYYRNNKNKPISIGYKEIGKNVYQQYSLYHNKITRHNYNWMINTYDIKLGSLLTIEPDGKFIIKSYTNKENEDLKDKNYDYIKSLKLKTIITKNNIKINI